MEVTGAVVIRTEISQKQVVKNQDGRQCIVHLIICHEKKNATNPSKLDIINAFVVRERPPATLTHDSDLVWDRPGWGKT